jgi:multicomponent Na+:H+ antiporter subunit A
VTLLLATLVGFAVAPLAVLAGRNPVRGGALLALVPAALFALFVALAGPATSTGGFVETIPWVPSLGIDLTFSLDGLSLVFALLITGIGALVVLYSGGYAKASKAVRLLPLLLAFMGSMLGLVLAGNLLVLAVFWSLTSLTSFLLIGLDREDPLAIGAARQALLITVAGELAMLGGIVLLGETAGTYEIAEIFAAGETLREDPLFPAMFLLILVGAITKSAQAPFHFWLPNAMAAPAPVSAYLHSATMVQAGVYLLARMHPLFGPSPLWFPVVVSFGLVTLLIGGLLAVRATDLKQVLAYSTVGALGLMVMLLGVGEEPAIVAAVVFLVGHALYKAALFLVVGTVDHETGERRPDALGGLGRIMPFTAAAGILAALSMAGLPPFFGFVGKELLYEATLPVDLLAEPGPALLVLAASFLGSVAFVAVAIIAGVRPFLGASTEAARRAHGEPLLLWIPPLLLAVLGVLIGITPGIVGGALVQPAVSAIMGEPTDVYLALWHGINPMLILSGITIAVGVLLWVGLARVGPVLGALDLGGRIGPQLGYYGFLSGLQRVALASSRLLQNGNLRHYLLTTIATMVVLVGAALLRTGGVAWNIEVLDVRAHELTAAALVVVAAIVAAVAESRVAAIAALGVAGYGVALLYLLFGAPDLAMTQILIETLTLVLFVLVFFHLPRMLSITRTAVRLRDAGISIAAGTVMGLLVLATLRDQPQETVSGYFVEAAYPLAHARNIVNAILVDFRALDTLGEIVVLALAALGVLALLRLPARERQA